LKLVLQAYHFYDTVVNLTLQGSLHFLSGAPLCIVMCRFWMKPFFRARDCSGNTGGFTGGKAEELERKAGPGILPKMEAGMRLHTALLGQNRHAHSFRVLF
jgi:hypothetical protein